MSDSEDILGDDLGDHSLADYNIGNEEEEQLLADDYERGESQNVPASLGPHYEDIVPAEYPSHRIEFNTQIPPPYIPSEPECVVPNISVEVPNVPAIREPLPTYAPYPERPYENEHAVPPPIPAPAVVEPPQIVPSELGHPSPSHEGSRDRFISERPPGAQRLPQVRDIPDSLDKVLVPRGSFPARGRSNTWRNPQLRRGHPYRHNGPRQGNFISQPSFPPPSLRQPPPQMRPQNDRPDMPLPPQIERSPERPMMPQGRPMMPQERPMIPQDMPFRPPMENRPFQPNFGPRFPNQFRPRMEEPRPNFIRPNFEQRPMFQQRPMFNQRPPYGQNIREIAPNMNQVLQVTIRQPGPNGPGNVGGPMPGPEVRMLPVQLPPNLPPSGLQGKKVLINPHFKGNFQPPDGPIKDIDDAAERFIAEQRNALARAANRKPQPRRSPQRYIENTTIEIENEMARSTEEDQDLLRRQQEFIQSNRDGLRRRMRSPPLAPRRSPERRRARTRSPPAAPGPAGAAPPHDEESEYRRRLREQESLRERVLRAKEVRRRKNAVALHKQILERDREKQEKESKDKDRTDRNQQEKDRKSPPKQDERRYESKPNRAERPRSPELVKPDTTRKSPEREGDRDRVRERSPIRKESEVNSTCENLTPPRPAPASPPQSPPRGLTPPLPRGGAVAGAKRRPVDSDDELELILDDIDGILSDEDDSGRFKENSKTEPVKSKQSVDLRSKLATKQTQEKSRSKIVFGEEKASRREKSPAKVKSPPRRTVVSSSTKSEQSDKKTEKAKSKSEAQTTRSRQRITFDTEKEVQMKRTLEKEKQDDTKTKSQFANRRVILQRKVNNSPPDKKEKSQKSDPSRPNPGIFSRAVRTAIGTENRIIIKKIDDTQIEYDSSSDNEDVKSSDTNVASVTNLPHGMTDTRLKTLAGNDVQSLVLDKEDRSAKITFKSTSAAEHFKKKFNNKMVAASRLTVILR